MGEAVRLCFCSSTNATARPSPSTSEARTPRSQGAGASVASVTYKQFRCLRSSVAFARTRVGRAQPENEDVRGTATSLAGHLHHVGHVLWLVILDDVQAAGAALGRLAQAVQGRLEPTVGVVPIQPVAAAVAHDEQRRPLKLGRRVATQGLADLLLELLAQLLVGTEVHVAKLVVAQRGQVRSNFENNFI